MLNLLRSLREGPLYKKITLITAATAGTGLLVYAFYRLWSSERAVVARRGKPPSPTTGKTSCVESKDGKDVDLKASTSAGARRSAAVSGKVAHHESENREPAEAENEFLLQDPTLRQSAKRKHSWDERVDKRNASAAPKSNDTVKDASETEQDEVSADATDDTTKDATETEQDEVSADTESADSSHRDGHMKPEISAFIVSKDDDDEDEEEARARAIISSKGATRSSTGKKIVTDKREELTDSTGRVKSREEECLQKSDVKPTGISCSRPAFDPSVISPVFAGRAFNRISVRSDDLVNFDPSREHPASFGYAFSAEA